jgi:hypothetical protein
MGKNRKCILFGRITWRNEALERPRPSLEDNTKMDLIERVRGCRLAQNRD